MLAIAGVNIRQNRFGHLHACNERRDLKYFFSVRRIKNVRLHERAGGRASERVKGRGARERASEGTRGRACHEPTRTDGLTRADASRRGPTRADAGRRGPTRTDAGRRGPTRADAGRRGPTRADVGEPDRPTRRADPTGRPADGPTSGRDKSGKRAVEPASV